MTYRFKPSTRKYQSKMTKLKPGHFTLVHQCDLRWNPVYDSILLMYQKLKDLGFAQQDGKIVITETSPP